MNKDALTLITTLSEELMAQLQIVGSVVVIEEEAMVRVQIETQEPGILIGYHGRNLEALQLLLGQMVYKKLGNWIRITVSVGDYRERREKQLQELAQSAATRAAEFGEPVVLTELTPAERRIIHLTLQDHAQVMSESEGEGRERRLVIKPRPQA